MSEGRTQFLCLSALNAFFPFVSWFNLSYQLFVFTITSNIRSSQRGTKAARRPWWLGPLSTEQGSVQYSTALMDLWKMHEKLSLFARSG